MKIMIAGIAGASLGTEIAKSLRLAGSYEIFGCDISPKAYGHFDPNFSSTYVIESHDYIRSLISLCHNLGVQTLIAGAEKTMVLIAQNAQLFSDKGITICQNNPDVIALCSNKDSCFQALGKENFAIPLTKRVEAPDDLDDFPMPCIIKPALDSGGSAYVFYAETRTDAKLYAAYLLRNGQAALAQKYISHEQGEFTVGVLSLPDMSVAGSIALKRSFASKLSVAAQGDGFLISSGYSQGEIRDFAEIRKTAEAIAFSIGSTGPINVQGRLNELGNFVPFEINPRFSATTYLRSMAGFNEIDFLIQHLAGRKQEKPLSVQEGWYLRSLDQTYTADLKAST